MASVKEKEISILHVEDNEDDVELLRLTLNKSNLKYKLKAVAKKKDFEEVNLDEYDIVISDHNLGEYTGLLVIETVRKYDAAKPIIILTGTVGEELAVQLLHVGANDFVLKTNYKKMPLAITRALSEHLLMVQRNKFQTELIEKKILLDTIFGAFHNIIFLKDVNGRYIKVNRAFSDFNKMHASEIIGKTNKELFSESSAFLSKSQESEDYVLLTGKQITYEIDHENDMGHKTTFEVVLTPILDGGTVTGLVGECKDVTRQKRLIDKAMRAQSVLKQAELLANAGSFEYDAELDILHCSSNFRRMMQLKIEGESISFRKFSQLVQEEDRELLVSGINHAIEHRSEYYLQHRFKMGDKTAYFNVFLKPDYKDSSGNMYYGTVVDVTAEQENHIYITEKQDEDRQEISRELHDNLGQKLTAVSMFISKISDGVPENKDLLKAKEITHEAIDDLRHLMNSISSRSVIEHSLEFAVKKLLEYMPDTFRVIYEIKLNENEFSNYVKSQVYRVIQEVINNAAKYSEASTLQLTLIQEGNLLNLVIEDDGKGFSLEEGMKGHGLQNITYRVRRSNGLININSKEGEGTKILVKMPIK